MAFVVSEKEGPHGILMVITDEDIVGKMFVEGKVQLDLTASFYKGIIQTKEDVGKNVHRAKDIHFTGREAVALGVEQSLIEPKRILWVKGVPHAESVLG